MNYTPTLQTVRVRMADKKALFTHGEVQLVFDALESLEARERAMKDAAEMLWVMLANVSGGDWKQQSEEWQAAAAKWRDYYFAALAPRRG